MRKLALAGGAVVLLAGCAGMSDTQQRALAGTGIAAAGGAVIVAMAGNAASVRLLAWVLASPVDCWLTA